MWALVVSAVLLVVLRIAGAHEMLWHILGGVAEPLRASSDEMAAESGPEEGPVSDQVMRLRLRMLNYGAVLESMMESMPNGALPSIRPYCCVAASLPVARMKAGILSTLMPVPWMGCTLATRFWLVGP